MKDITTIGIFNELISADYLDTMRDSSVDYVELGFRSLKNNSLDLARAFTTNEFYL